MSIMSYNLYGETISDSLYGEAILKGKQMELISSSEAREKLKASTSTFKRLVDTGKIRKVTPPNKKQGMYIREDVDKIAEEMKPFSGAARYRNKQGNQELSTATDWQKISDLPAILKLDLKVYQENIVGDIGLYISWEKKNPKITLLSFESNNREHVLAYISLVPLPEQTILSILKGERPELSISADEVETYERKGGYTLLAESVVVDPDHPEQLNNVLREVLKYWCRQYPDRYIEKIYADATTKHGDMLARKLYFSPLYHLSDTAYVLDLRKPGISQVVRSFQECLSQKALRTDGHKEKPDSKTDSKADRKSSITVDPSRQNSTNQKPPGRSKSHTTKVEPTLAEA